MAGKRSIIRGIGLCVVVACALWLGVSQAKADGIIIPDPPPDPEPVPLTDQWLTIRYHHVEVKIEGQLAVTRVEQEFINQHEWEVEGRYVFPLPDGAAISNFQMWVDGVPVEAKILPAKEARQIYEDIVRRRRDPALLEYVGQKAIQLRIYPIPAGGTRKIELKYGQPLKNDAGLVEYVYPLDTEKFSARPLESCAVRVEVQSQVPLHAVYSPTHHDRLSLRREGDHYALASYEENDVLPEEDFELVYSVAEEEIGLNVLTYVDRARVEGYFLLLASPRVKVDHVVPRDIVFVLDTSGSMEGEKLIQAKDALAYVLDHLNPEDRFNVLTFSSGLRRFAGTLQPPSRTSQALDWVEDQEALGGTDINRGLLEALAVIDAERRSGASAARPAVLIFLTDGLPTEGVTDVADILANMNQAAPDRLRLFPFGVGDDVNTVLLDTLAENHRGTSAYVRPHESIEEEVSSLYAKIKKPVLTDIQIEFKGVEVEDLYPRILPDLFAGSQLLQVGKYRLPSSSPAKTEVVLSGVVNGERKEYMYQAEFAGLNTGLRAEWGTRSFIPRLWATRKIGHFMTQIRLHGEGKEWVQAIVDLSVRYGIITPYTSFLIDEEDILTQQGKEEAVKEYMARPQGPVVGGAAAEKAEMEGALRGADSVPRLPLQDHPMAASDPARALRTVGSKTFLWDRGVWVDTAFDPKEMVVKQVGFGSEGYFELLAARPEWGDYLALGEEVIFVAEGQAYQVVVGEGEDIDLSPHTAPDGEPEGDPELSSPPSPPLMDWICPGSLMWGVAFWLLAIRPGMHTGGRHKDPSRYVP